MPDRDRAHERFCTIVCLEVACCFLVPFVALFIGAVFLPFMIIATVTSPQDTWTWRNVAQVILGSAGLGGVTRAVYLIWTGSRHDRWRWITLLGLACGAAVSVDHWIAVLHRRVPGGLDVLIPFVYLPLGCALHLVYLARRPLFWRRGA